MISTNPAIKLFISVYLSLTYVFMQDEQDKESLQKNPDILKT